MVRYIYHIVIVPTRITISLSFELKFSFFFLMKIKWVDIFICCRQVRVCNVHQICRTHALAGALTYYSLVWEWTLLGGSASSHCEKYKWPQHDDPCTNYTGAWVLSGRCKHMVCIFFINCRSMEYIYILCDQDLSVIFPYKCGRWPGAIRLIRNVWAGVLGWELE